MNQKQKQRTSDAGWLLEQITRLAESAEENTKEDAQRAESERSEDAAVSTARSETAEHYAKELRRILDGVTWDEAFMRGVKEARR